MAQMIPERLPSRASRGEERLFDVLKRLPDNCIVYYEPIVTDRYPDFVVIIPALGVLVIEVKGWYLGWIDDADEERVSVREDGGPVRKDHPTQQARQYMYRLMDEARRCDFAKVLLHPSGERAGNFLFPFGYFALLTNITREQMNKSDKPRVRQACSSGRNVTRDVLEHWESLDSDQLMGALKTQFNPFWPIEPLNQRQIDRLRGVIHSDIVISSPALSDGDCIPEGVDALKVLDLQQEREARNIRSGHRIIRGVAGSGKTVLLIARSKLLAADPIKRVLVLCFNKPLAAYLRLCIRDHPNLTAKHFHDWGGSNGIPYKENESGEDYGRRFLARLERGEGDAGRFDAVLLDEYQDFALSWFKCAKLALKEPEDGDLLIVGDASQSLYDQRGFTWSDAGINARGRSAILEVNYRNTREMMLAAASFASVEGAEDLEGVGHRIPPSIENCRRSGHKVEVSQCKNLFEEVEKAAERIREWVGGKDGNGQRFRPHEIGILCRRLDKPAYKKALDRLREVLSPYGTVRLSGKLADGSYADPGIKITSIHGAKGLQFPAVLMLWADLLPLKFSDRSETSERNLMYVALTRAEHVLVVSHSGPSKYVNELRQNLGLPRAETVLGQPWLPG
jgi:hypothetical protein